MISKVEIHVPTWAAFTLEISLIAHRQLRLRSPRLLPVLRSILSGSLVLALCSPAAAAEPATTAVTTSEANNDSPNVQPTDEELATARMNFANGVELISGSSPNYQDAYRQFQLALKLTHGSWKVKGNLGLCALKLERDGEALEYYEGYLKDGGAEIDPDERQHIEREMLLIKGNLAELGLTSSSPETRFSVSRQGSSAPPQIYETTDGESNLGLRAGTLSVEATDDQDRTLSFQVTISAGDSAKHHFDFEKKVDVPPAAAQAKTSEPSAESQPMSGLRIAGIVTAGVGLAALGGGAVFGILSQNEKKNAEKSCINNVCAEDSESDFDSAKTKATVANILFISGGVLAATGITLVIVGGNTQTSNETAIFNGQRDNQFSLQLTPTAQASGGGLVAWGKF